jgi:hypothetical protein
VTTLINPALAAKRDAPRTMMLNSFSARLFMFDYAFETLSLLKRRVVHVVFLKGTKM